MSLEPPQNGVGNSGFEPLGREEQSGALPPNAPISRAATPLCIEPRRTLPVVDDGSDGAHAPIAYPDTMQYHNTDIEKQ